LRPGDLVKKIGDKPVQNTGELFAAVAALQPGSEVAIGVQRREQALLLRVQVAERRKAALQAR
jgi:S1-C subfamily serine protease